MISTNLLRTLLWLLATLEISISMYVLVLNARNKVNLHIAWLMFIFAVNSFGLGMLVQARDIEGALLPMQLLTGSSLSLIASTWILTVILLYPEPPRWLKFIRGFMYVIVAMPIILTLIDVIFGTTLWFYIAFDPNEYAGGYISGGDYGSGLISSVLRAPLIYLTGLTSILPPLVALFQRENTRSRRGLAGLLLGTQILTIFLQVGLRGVIITEISTSLVNVVFSVGYGYAAFSLLLSDNTMQSGRLQSRLTLLSLVVTVPVLVLVSFTVADTGRSLLIESSELLLENTARTIYYNIDGWLNENVSTLQFLATQTDIRSMDPEQQLPSLQRMVSEYPYMYLTSSTDLNGINVARSDGVEAKDYSDRDWFNQAVNGQSVTYQVLVGRTSGEPALVVSTPIREGDEGSAIQGVLMFAATLDDLSVSVQSIQSERLELDYYVVDENNQVILESESHASHAHGEGEHDGAMHEDEAELPPVHHARNFGTGVMRYRDAGGDAYIAYTEKLSNGWIIVVERDEQSLLEPASLLQNNNILILGISVALIIALISATVRQSLRPVGSLASTANAIIEGDLSQRAPIESEDELGELAQSFNAMTARLNETINGLEDRVQRRTAAIEQRSQYLQASAEIGRAASTILDTEELFRESVELIRNRFGLYYVGLFQVDQASEWAVLRAGTGEAGQRMLARDHRILVGTGMVGWSIANNQSRITSRAEEDVVRLASSELPDTRSEAALPLTSRGTVLGALTVQSTEVDFFDEDTLTVLQTMADQMAVAIDNASLYTSMQATLEAERRAFGQAVTGSIQDIAGGANDWLYNRSSESFERPVGNWHSAMLEAQRKAGAVVKTDTEAGQTLAVPIKVRDEVVGVLDLNRASGGTWTPQEIALLETITEQMGAALESALLYETSQRRASREQMIRQITENISAASTVEDAMRRAMQSLADVANARQVAVRIGSQQMLSVQGDAHE